MFGCESAAARSASARKRRRWSASAISSSLTTVNATVRPGRGSRARQVSPSPPAPTHSRIRYCPIASSMERPNYTGERSLSVLRSNRNFRLLFIGQTISQLGDWFNSVAVFALLLDLTGSATAVAWMMIVQFLPVAIVGALPGVVVGRVGRRRLMIVTDLLRGALVLVLLVIRRPDQVWIAYVVMAVIVGAQGFFEPARTATIPNITAAEELMPANALSSATWSAMLAIGASIGGIVAAVAGRNVAFVINGASFFASAFFIAQTRYDSAPAAAPRPSGLLALTGITDLIEGAGYVRQRAHVAA